MSFNDALTAVFTPALVWLFPAIFMIIAALSFKAPSARKRLAAAGMLAVSAAAGLFLAAALRWFGVTPQSLQYRAIFALSCFLISTSAINTLGVMVFGLLLPAMRVTLPALMQDIVLAAVYVMTGFVILSGAGVDFSGILATSAVVTAVVMFSLQDTFGNLIGGMVLHAESYFSPGDRLRVGTDEGVVKEIRWRHTAIQTGEGDIVVMPNSALMKGMVTVLGKASASYKRFSRISFHAGYEYPPNSVINTLNQALAEDLPDGVAPAPPPRCLFSELDDKSARYSVGYWLTSPILEAAAASELRVKIYYALARAGIKVSVQLRSVVITENAAELQQRRGMEEFERRIRALRGMDIFQGLTDPELKALADELKSTPFAKGETITRQGANADWLYIINEGSAEVRLHSESGSSFRAVATLGRGNFLGEMGLMTGEPRSATVVALSDVGCYRLERNSFREILAKRPALAETISLVLAKRRLELEAARGVLKEEAVPDRIAREQGSLLSSIRDFFGLKVL